jgi:hypothetical protein
MHHPLAEEYYRTAAVSKVIEVTGDARRLTLCSVGLLAADLIGAAAVVSASLARGYVLALGSVGLLLPAIAGWLVTAALVLLSERPVFYAFDHLRWETGAPVDPAAPWSPLGVLPLADSVFAWDHVAPLIAATTVRQARARRALTSAIITTVGIFFWIALSLAITTII